MRIDVHSTIIMLSILATFAAIWAVSTALKAIRSSRKIPSVSYTHLTLPTNREV